MKTKIYLITAIVSCCTVIPAFSSDKGDRGGNSDGGISISSFSRSFSPVTFSVNPNQSVDVYLASNLGGIQVMIKNNVGVVVYTKQVNTSLINELTIHISNYPQGDYTISFTDQSGRTLKNGAFRVD